MKSVNLGLIGAWGLRGKMPQYALQEPKVNIIAAADIYEDSLMQCTEHYAKLGQSIQSYTDYRQLLADPKLDAVFIATPDYLHFEHATAALEAGKHVYLEKPMATSLADCDLLLETAYRAKSKLFLGHNMRYFPTVLKMKELIDSGIIGQIQAVWCRHFVSYGGEAYFKDWHSEQRYSNGLLLQKGAHDIDVIHWLCGSYSQKVVGMGKLSVYNQMARRDKKQNKNPNQDNTEAPNSSANEPTRYIPFQSCGWEGVAFPPETDQQFAPIIDVEDHNMLFMQLENGVQASYMHCMYSPTCERNYVFLGTKGKLENIGDVGDCEIHVYTQMGEYRKPNIVYKVRGTQSNHGGADPEIMRAFIQFIRNETSPNTSPIAGRMAVATGAAGTKSIRNGCMPVTIPSLDAKLLQYFQEGQKA